MLLLQNECGSFGSAGNANCQVHAESEHDVVPSLSSDLDRKAYEVGVLLGEQALDQFHAHRDVSSRHLVDARPAAQYDPFTEERGRQDSLRVAPDPGADLLSNRGVVRHPLQMSDTEVQICWRGDVTDEELAELTMSLGGSAAAGWWMQVRGHSLGWVVARDADDLLVAFVNVAWDGAHHAFLIDTKTRPSHQRQGLGRAVVERAVDGARSAGCEWLFVDFEPPLAAFYLDGCGFRPTQAGLIRLK